MALKHYAQPLSGGGKPLALTYGENIHWDATYNSTYLSNATVSAIGSISYTNINQTSQGYTGWNAYLQSQETFKLGSFKYFMMTIGFSAHGTSIGLGWKLYAKSKTTGELIPITASSNFPRTTNTDTGIPTQNTNNPDNTMPNSYAYAYYCDLGVEDISSNDEYYLYFEFKTYSNPVGYNSCIQTCTITDMVLI